ncbi:MAG: shikimate kinase [Candidatus Omnitrophica bacterium]|nr:shikimate kinase [Candidatus Omnitrophota bacterium]
MSPTRRIIVIGMKSSGKTTTGKLLARKLGLPFTDMDSEIERLHREEKGERLRFRDIFTKYGKDYFRNLETSALRALSDSTEPTSFVLATGGGLPLAEENRKLLARLGLIVFLDVAQEVLLPRILAGGIPAFFPYPDDPARSLAEILEVRRPIYRALAQITIECRAESPKDIADNIVNQLEKHHGEN